MDRERFDEIFSEDSDKWEGDNAIQGLKIIEKYMPGSGIEGAEHDIIYSVEVDALIEAGITVEDAKKLRDINWMIDDGGMACFV